MATEIPLKTLKNVFCFTLESLFVLKILTFVLDFMVVLRNGLIRKVRLISKFIRLLTGKQTIAILYTYRPISQEVQAIRQ